jgi:hypothetical protein
VDWIHLAWDRDLVNPVVNFWAIKGKEFFDWLRDYQLLKKLWRQSVIHFFQFTHIYSENLKGKKNI